MAAEEQIRPAAGYEQWELSRDDIKALKNAEDILERGDPHDFEDARGAAPLPSEPAQPLIVPEPRSEALLPSQEPAPALGPVRRPRHQPRALPYEPADGHEAEDETPPLLAIADDDPTIESVPPTPRSTTRVDDDDETRRATRPRDDGGDDATGDKRPRLDDGTHAALITDHTGAVYLQRRHRQWPLQQLRMPPTRPLPRSRLQFLDDVLAAEAEATCLHPRIALKSPCALYVAVCRQCLVESQA